MRMPSTPLTFSNTCLLDIRPPLIARNIQVTLGAGFSRPSKPGPPGIEYCTQWLGDLVPQRYRALKFFPSKRRTVRVHGIGEGGIMQAEDLLRIRPASDRFLRELLGLRRTAKPGRASARRCLVSWRHRPVNPSSPWPAPPTCSLKTDEPPGSRVLVRRQGPIVPFLLRGRIRPGLGRVPGEPPLSGSSLIGAFQGPPLKD